MSRAVRRVPRNSIADFINGMIPTKPIWVARAEINLLLTRYALERMPGRPAVRDWKRSASQCVELICPKIVGIFRTGCACLKSEKDIQISDMPDLKSKISSIVSAAAPGSVWTPADFAALGSRDAVDKALQRLALAGELRRIDRGLYDRPVVNRLTKRPTTPDYRAVLDAIARRDQLRMLVDGMTAANDLGMTDAVPARVTIHTDARRRSIQLDNLVIEFKQTAPSRLYWAGRPAMRVVQALHWLKDTLGSDRDRILQRLDKILAEPVHGPAIRQDLIEGFAVLPAWMRELLRELPSFDPLATRYIAPSEHSSVTRGASRKVRVAG